MNSPADCEFIIEEKYENGKRHSWMGKRLKQNRPIERLNLPRAQSKHHPRNPTSLRQAGTLLRCFGLHTTAWSIQCGLKVRRSIEEQPDSVSSNKGGGSHRCIGSNRARLHLAGNRWSARLSFTSDKGDFKRARYDERDKVNRTKRVVSWDPFHYPNANIRSSE